MSGLKSSEKSNVLEMSTKKELPQIAKKEPVKQELLDLSSDEELDLSSDEEDDDSNISPASPKTAVPLGKSSKLNHPSQAVAEKLSTAVTSPKSVKLNAEPSTMSIPTPPKTQAPAGENSKPGKPPAANIKQEHIKKSPVVKPGKKTSSNAAVNVKREGQSKHSLTFMPEDQSVDEPKRKKARSSSTPASAPYMNTFPASDGKAVTKSRKNPGKENAEHAPRVPEPTAPRQRNRGIVGKFGPKAVSRNLTSKDMPPSTSNSAVQTQSSTKKSKKAKKGMVSKCKTTKPPPTRLEQNSKKDPKPSDKIPFDTFKTEEDWRWKFFDRDDVRGQIVYRIRTGSSLWNDDPFKCVRDFLKAPQFNRLHDLKSDPAMAPMIESAYLSFLKYVEQEWSEAYDRKEKSKDIASRFKTEAIDV
jgi:hypothetical protein